MLGNGREFMIKLVSARRIDSNFGKLEEIENKINKEESKI